MPFERDVGKGGSFDDLARKAEDRLQMARQIADRCIDDEVVHRAAMKAVFVLEDTLFALRQIADDFDRAEDTRAFGAMRQDNRD